MSSAVQGVSSRRPARRHAPAEQEQRRTEVDDHVAQALRAFRLSAGLTQQEAGARLAVRGQTIHKMEKGATRISAAALKLAADAYGVPVDAFFPAARSDRTRPAALDRRSRRLLAFMQDVARIRDESTLEVIARTTRLLTQDR
jgi:transcriptional regulator with XRE-family HTH domain